MAGTLLATVVASETKLTASDAAAGDMFGRTANSLALSGGTAVIGAYLSDDAGANSGSVYIFVDDGTGWSEQAKLTASDAAPVDLFGYAVSISGDTVAIGSFHDDGQEPDVGSVYVYERSSGTWPETAKLRAGDGAEGDWLGRAVAMSGNSIVAGARKHAHRAVDAGAAYIFRFDGTSWAQEAELNANDGAAGDYLGVSVGIDGDVAVVGAPLADVGGPDSGAAYVFRWDGTSWSQEAKLVASDGDRRDWLGFSVGISGDTVVVGAHRKGPGRDKGAVYVFRFDGITWSQEAKLTASDAKANDAFGFSVAIDGETVVVGARRGDDRIKDTGTVYVFERTGTVWSEELKLSASDGAKGDFFGEAVSVFESTVLVGAPRDDDAGQSSGSVYVYEMTSS